MKLLRWAVAGASVYAVYKYSIGNKAKGEDIFTSAEKAVADLEDKSAAPEPAPEKPAKRAARPKRTRKPAAKSASKA